MEIAEAVTRWDTFLSRISTRAAEILMQAEQGCTMLLDLNELDPQPMSNAWTAIENQLRELDAKIASTWDDKMAPALAEDQDACQVAEQRGAELRQRLERDGEDVRVRIFAGAARKVFDRARQLLAKSFPCSQCQAPQVVSDHFFRSRHVTCTHCGRINTFIPSAKVMAVEYFCCHYLAEESALPSRRAWQEAERRMHADHENLALMRATELAMEAHLRTYLETRIAIVPDYRDDFTKDLRGRMACFYDQMSHTPGWVPRPDQP